MQELAWQAMGLQQDPFPLGGSDEIFLQTPALGQRLSLFTQLTQASDLTLLLIGEPGIGKTTFLERVTEVLEDGWRIVQLEAGADTTFDELRTQLYDGLALGDVTQDAADLSAHIEALSASGYRALVMVDDAHLLSDDALVPLLELGREVRLALAGENTLADRVAAASEHMLNADAGLVHRIVLGELNLPQTTDYLRARLSRSGFEDATPFTSEICAQIYQRSRGIPGTINALASEFLEIEPLATDDDESIELDPPGHDTKAVKAKLTTHAPIQPRISLHAEPGRQMLRQAGPMVAMAVLVLALLAAGYGLVTWLNSEDAAFTDDNQADAAPTSPNTTDDRYPELPTAPAPPPPTILADQNAPLVNTLTDAPVETSENPAPPPPAPESAAADVTEDAREVAANLNLAPLRDADTATSEPNVTTRPRPRRAPRQRRDESAVVPAATAAVEARPPPAVPARNTSRSWLENGDKDRFTVQLIALGSAAATREFIRRNRLTGALVVSLKTPDAKPLFAVVQGVYDRREKALDAIRKMPPQLRQEAPWPRHVGTLLEAAHAVRTP